MVPADVDFHSLPNGTGFQGQVMIDLQRILACLQIYNKKPEPRFLSMVSRETSFSSKMVMAMNAQSEWRLGQPRYVLSVKRSSLIISIIIYDS